MNQIDNETICEQLFNDFRGLLTWKWDDQARTFLTDFDTEKELNIRTVVEKHLPNLWDISNIHRASPGVQEVYKNLGKLRPTQFLFSSDLIGEDFVFCAWWPWDNGQKISLRLAPYNKNLTKAKKDKLIGQLMAIAEL